ncbi:MAG: hypothetical protein ACXVXJ_04690 [Mycobacteriaceae bacterium]
MSDGDVWQRYDAIADRIIRCTGDCTKADHVRAVRFALLRAYDDGQRDANRRQERSVP